MGIKITFKTAFMDQQKNTTKLEREFIQTLRDPPFNLSIRKIAYIVERSKSTIHEVLNRDNEEQE
jgi:IS30 family transposase